MITYIHDGHGACGDRFGGLFHLHQAHPAVASYRQPVMVAEPRDLHSNHRRSLSKKRTSDN